MLVVKENGNERAIICACGGCELYSKMNELERTMKGTLYAGDGRKIMDVRDVDFTVTSESTAEISEAFAKPCIPSDEIEITVSSYISPWVMIGLITGKRPTNNWMKMHGGIMERKVQIRKARFLMNRKRRTEEENGNG